MTPEKIGKHFERRQELRSPPVGFDILFNSDRNNPVCIADEVGHDAVAPVGGVDAVTARDLLAQAGGHLRRVIG